MLAKTATKYDSGTMHVNAMYGITGCHIERNAEFPGENASAKLVYIAAIKWKCAAA